MEDTLPADPYAQTDFTWPPEMVLALSQGLEEPEAVARRFGWEGVRWKRLQKNKAFQIAVEAQMAELAKSGWVMVTKAKMGAEMLQDELLKIALRDDTTPAQKLAIYEALCKTGNVNPKEGKVGAAEGAAGFVINIVLDRNASEASVKTRPVVIEMETDGEGD